MLVEGVDVVGQIDKKARFLRRIRVDPMTGDDEWGLRSYQDEPDSTSWGGENVYDVYSLSGGTGLNGSRTRMVTPRHASPARAAPAARLHAARADHRRGDHRHPGVDRHAGAEGHAAARERVGAEDQPADDARPASTSTTATRATIPQSLEVLVEKGYVRMVPYDPLTKSATTWQLDLRRARPADRARARPTFPKAESRASSTCIPARRRLALDGTPYAEW